MQYTCTPHNSRGQSQKNRYAVRNAADRTSSNEGRDQAMVRKQERESFARLLLSGASRASLLQLPSQPGHQPWCLLSSVPSSLFSCCSANESANSLPLQSDSHVNRVLESPKKKIRRQYVNSVKWTYTSLALSSDFSSAFAPAFSPDFFSSICLASAFFCSSCKSSLSFAHCEAPSSKSF